MKKLTVVALGGNALLRANQQGTVEEQEQNSFDSCKMLLPLIKNRNLIITHGNGPQVGNIYLRSEAGHSVFGLPRTPLDISVADSQGEIGYMIERQLRNVIVDNNLKKKVVTLLSQVVVSNKDKSFKEPTKPIGSYYLKEEADLMALANKWMFKEDAKKRGWRRVVASPTPLEIINSDLIKNLAKKGEIVIAVGGGGIPVYIDEKNNYRPIEDAVIDKDLSASLLASVIGADEFIILTDVPMACINFNKPNQKELNVLKVSQAKSLLKKGEFGEGSMKPKIQAAVNFILNGGKEAIITEASCLNQENFGTRIIQ